ncbi:hypothetical protein B0F90DRAFT_334440 [Multifurca ochricompacta]|uniref:Uncharacterized protein n=1 Tax=Multifurca ochricompacta TaxID=376703 RepID=A0AAD4LX70_9AGAM|nr:hypothetical protein B0F90DRAFT_334440 [Multifurca ochricompacta]
MEFYNNLDPSLFPQYDTFMQSHDLPGEYQASQMIQNLDTFQLPPGAEATDSPSFTLRRQAGYFSQALPPQGYTQTEEHAGRMLTTSAVNSQSDGSESSLYAPSPSDSNSPSPSPSPSHVFNLRALIPRIGPVSFSHRIPDNATRDIPQNHHPLPFIPEIPLIHHTCLRPRTPFHT